MTATTLRLTHGKIALIDLEDYDRVSRYKWTAVWAHYDWRATARVNGRNVYLHRFIMGAAKGTEIDHRNGDGLDCRKENLRVATHSQNNANAMRRPAKRISRFKGVHKHPTPGRWKARIKLNGHQRHLGTFTSEIAAAMAYDAAAVEAFGEFAATNFPVAVKGAA